MMGMLGDKKKFASIILSERPVEKPVSNGLDSDFSPAYGQLGKQILEYVEAGDGESLAKALKDLVMLAVRESEYQE